MKKGYQFKLEAVLKIRKMEEEKCKVQIGQIQVRIKMLSNEISKHNQGIEESYSAQEEGLSSGLSGQELQFHPFFIKGKRAHIDNLEAEIQMLTAKVNEKYDELRTLRANVKVIDKMKEKGRVKYKKALEKKQFEQLEEQVQNWRVSQK